MKVKDKWFRFVAITLIWAMAVYANKLYLQPFTWKLLVRVLLIPASIFLTWQGNRFIILHFREKFSGEYALARRIAFIFVTGMLFTWVMLIATAIVTNMILYGSGFALAEITSSHAFEKLLSFPLFLQFALFFGIYEALYYYSRLKYIEEEKKQLEKEKLWAQLEKLNQQVSPHFLFNTLNSLSSLITEDPMEADRFLNEMTKVYRYLLDNNQHELVTLQTEIKFIHSFYQLLKLRYGAGVELNIEIPAEYETYQIPPLTLQLLVENAVKHNITSRSQPLHIVIRVTDSGRLMVKNNLQRKKDKPVSHKIGLDNIAVKYQLMRQEEIVIREENEQFIVLLPLIHPSASRDADWKVPDNIKS